MRDINLARAVSLFLLFSAEVTFGQDNKLTETYHHCRESILDLVRLFAKHHPLLALVAESSVVARSGDVEPLVGPGNCIKTPLLQDIITVQAFILSQTGISPIQAQQDSPVPPYLSPAPSTCSDRRVLRWGPLTNVDLASTANQFHKLGDPVGDFEAEKTRPGQSKPKSRSWRRWRGCGSGP